MGYIDLGSPAVSIEIPDRALAHLQAVVIPKLRNGESFTFSWRHTTEQGSGRSTLWVHPSPRSASVTSAATPSP